MNKFDCIRKPAPQREEPTKTYSPLKVGSQTICTQ